jgi:preprotein translocase subunit SecG
MQFLPWIQIVLSAILIGLVLLQQSEAGLGAWSGGTSGASNFRTKRGPEKVVFILTIIVALGFIVSSIGALFV